MSGVVAGAAYVGGQFGASITFGLPGNPLTSLGASDMFLASLAP